MYYRKMWGKRIKNGDKKKMNRETTLKRPYALCPKINRKNYRKNRKKVLTLGESVVLYISCRARQQLFKSQIKAMYQQKRSGEPDSVRVESF